VPLQGGTAQRLTTLEAQHPVFSPDSTRIICQIREPGSEWSAAVLSFRDGSIVQKFPLLPVNSVAHWSPDANGIDYTVGTAVGSEIWRQPLNGEPPVRLIQTGEGNIAAFAWNSNGTKLAYVRTRAESDVVLLQRSLRK